LSIALLLGWLRRMSLLAFIERMYSKKYNSRKSKEEDLRECGERSGETKSKAVVKEGAEALHVIVANMVEKADFTFVG
jgi:hypothetical protein